MNHRKCLPEEIPESETRQGMVFSKSAFLKSESGRGCKHLLGGHLDIINGMPVQNTAGERYGSIYYKTNGKEYELYPVMPEWCEEKEQTSLF